MTLNNTDIDKMQRELAILMTNSIELQNKMYDIFVNPNPCDVELRVWTTNGFETIVIPNLAKSRVPVMSGEESPVGTVSGDIGTLYIDTKTEYIYVNLGKDKDIEGKSTTWVQLATAYDIEEHDKSDSAHFGVLATINGEKDTPFYVANVDASSDPQLAVNVESYDAMLGYMERLQTTDNEFVVDGINELLYTTEKEVGVIVDSNLNRVNDTKKPKIFRVVTSNSNSGVYNLVMDPGLSKFTAIKVNGTKYVCNRAYGIQPWLNLNGPRIQVFLKDLDKDTPRFECVTNGEYYIGETKPYIMKEGDVWLDTGCRPYKMYQMVKDVVTDVLSEEEVDYIYLGVLEEV